MDSEQLRRLEALYEAALGVEPARRAAFLAENCAGDESLRREVESLLRDDDNAGSFLEAPALEMLPDRARLTVGQHVSHYEIQEKLGEGGMGPRPDAGGAPGGFEIGPDNAHSLPQSSQWPPLGHPSEQPQHLLMQ